MRDIYIKGVKLNYFNDLDQNAQKVAMSHILLDEQDHIGRLIKQYKRLGLHIRINNRKGYKEIISRKRLLLKLSDESYLKSFIESNRCMFFADGSYYRFYPPSDV